jgi:hypothetical protein
MRNGDHFAFMASYARRCPFHPSFNPERGVPYVIECVFCHDIFDLYQEFRALNRHIAEVRKASIDAEIADRASKRVPVPDEFFERKKRLGHTLRPRIAEAVGHKGFERHIRAGLVYNLRWLHEDKMIREIMASLTNEQRLHIAERMFKAAMGSGQITTLKSFARLLEGWYDTRTCTNWKLQHAAFHALKDDGTVDKFVNKYAGTSISRAEST